MDGNAALNVALYSKLAESVTQSCYSGCGARILMHDEVGEALKSSWVGMRSSTVDLSDGSLTLVQPMSLAVFGPVAFFALPGR